VNGYLLDTDAVLLLSFQSERAPPSLRDALAQAPLRVSLVSAIEMAIKHSIGKLALSPAYELNFANGFLESLNELSASLLPVEVEHIDVLNRLPMMHRDPFDRLLISQALVEGLTLVSGDRKFALYPGLPLLRI